MRRALRNGGVLRLDARAREASAWACLLAVVLLLAGCGQAPPPSGEPRPWTGAVAVSDPEFEGLLRPDVPVEASGLRRARDGAVYYVAQLRDEPPAGYGDKYNDLIRARGVLIFAHSGSPHKIPPRVVMYNFFVFKKGTRPLYSLRYRRFSYTDEGWLKEHTLRGLPGPITIAGRELALRLGDNALQPWSETVLVPERDVEDVKELPFPRYPGSVLCGMSRGSTAKELLTERGVFRSYVVVGASTDEILQHYRQVIQAYGVPIEPSESARAVLRWWGGERRVKGLTQVRVERRYFAPIPGSDLDLKQIRGMSPALLPDFPQDALTFEVSLDFVKSEDAAVYWSAEDQARRREALEKAPAQGEDE